VRKLLFIIPILFFVIFIAACTQKDVEDEPQFLDVQLSATPDKAAVNEEITFKAEISYGTEKVTDADEVKFEIWRSHSNEHEKIVVEHSADGVYKLKKSFSEEGTYYIISHVTARSMHNMPKVEFIVGKPSEPEKKSGMDMEEKDTDSTEEHSGH
jgi:pullulanase/glycogen debranching enzyme